MSRIKQKWDSVILRDLCDQVQYGYTASAEAEAVGPKFLRITDITPERIEWDTVPYCNIEPENIEKYLLHEGDIVIARTGATTGYAKYIKRHPKVVFASYLVRLKLKDKINKRYIGFAVESDEYKRFIFSNIGGAAQPNANAQVLTSFHLPLPPLSAQNQIAFILSAYDDLIENNNRRIKILEEMAQALYKEWFVNFRFPGHTKVKMVRSKLGMIPEEWEVVKIGEILRKLERKLRIKKEDYLEQGEIPAIDQGAEFIGGYTNDYDALHDNPLPIIIFGDHTRVLKYVDFPFASGADGTQLLYPKNEELMPAYFYYAVRNIDLSNFAYARHFKFLKEHEVLIPNNPTLKLFNENVGLFLKQMSIFRKRNDTLRKTRDLLLPKLISGEIDVEGLDIRTEIVNPPF